MPILRCCEHLCRCHCEALSAPGGGGLRVTFAACAHGQLGLVAPFAVGISPGCAGSAVRGLKSAEIMPPAVAPRVMAALRPRRLGRRRMHSAAAAPRSARPAREDACLRRGHARRRCRSARRGWGSGAGSPLLLGVTATAMPRALAETPNADSARMPKRGAT
jgi:hypothetical protein